MSTKNISIDVEAYRRLARAKKPNESFSQVIKRTVQPPFDLDAWLKKLEAMGMDEKFARAVETQVSERRRPSSRRR